MSTVLWIIVLLIIAVAILISILGRVGVLKLIAGPADQGPADFANLRTRGTPNDALVAPEGYVQGKRTIDAVAPIFDHPAEKVRLAIRQVALAEALVEQVGSDNAGLHDRYVQRTPTMRFPDTLDIKVIPLEGGKSTVAVYSRALVGIRDYGVNRARIDRWLGKAAKALA